MMKLDRRKFLRYGSAAAASVWASAFPSSSLANPMGWPLGFQGYDVRFLIIKDWDSGWKTMRDMGYQSVDMVSFKGYGYENSPLASMPAKEPEPVLCQNVYVDQADGRSGHDTP